MLQGDKITSWLSLSLLASSTRSSLAHSSTRTKQCCIKPMLTFPTITGTLTFKSDRILFASSPKVNNNFCHTESFNISLIYVIPGIADTVPCLSDNYLPLVQSRVPIACSWRDRGPAHYFLYRMRRTKRSYCRKAQH